MHFYKHEKSKTWCYFNIYPESKTLFFTFGHVYVYLEENAELFES